MEWIIGIAIAGWGLWWLFKPSKTIQQSVPTSSVTPRYDNNQDELEDKPVEELNADELEVRKAYETFERQSKERTEDYQAKKREIREDEEKLAKAKQYVETSHLDLALPYVQDETKFWPSWSKLPDDRKWTPPIPMTDIDGVSGAAKETWVQFRAGDSLFRIDMQESRMPIDDSQFADMQLSVDGQQVLGIGVVRDWTKEYDRWRFVAVDCLRVGPWMSEFVELYGRLRAVNEGGRQNSTNEYVAGRAANIELGGRGL